MAASWWCIGFGTACAFFVQEVFDLLYGFGVVSVTVALITGTLSMLGLAAYLRAGNGE